MWLKRGLDFEEAMTALKKRLEEVCDMSEYLFLDLGEETYLIKDVMGTPSPWIISEFDKFYAQKYRVTVFKDDYTLYAADPQRCKFRIFALLNNHGENVEEGASINEL